MRAIAPILIAVALLSPVAAKPRKDVPRAKAVSSPAAPAVGVSHEADGDRADLSWDGPLLGWAVPRDPQGRRTLYALIGPRPDTQSVASCGVDDAASREPAHDARLFRWGVAAKDRLDEIRSGLPHGSLEAADLDGDGREELVLLRDGEIDELLLPGVDDRADSLRPLVRDEAIGGAGGDPRAARSAVDSLDTSLRLTLAGEFRTYGRGAAGQVASTSAIDLPIRIVPGRTRIAVDTPEVVALGRVPRKGALFATDPEPVGARRLKTVLLEPDAPAEAQAVTCWAQLPGPERALDVAFAVMEGRPVLIVTTMSAEKLDVFGEKKLRVYALGSDRTRAGDAPWFAATTGLNIWQMGHPVVTDLDRDGRDDLVIGYWKGLKRTIAALEVYRGDPDGALGKPHRMEIDVDEGDVGFLSFGRDADGDGRPDLIVLAARGAVVYPGSRDGAATRPVGERPSRRVSLPSGSPGADSVDVSFELGNVTISRRVPGFGTPRPIDLEGEGRVDLVFAGNLNGTGRVSVIAFRGAERGISAQSSLAPSETTPYK